MLNQDAKFNVFNAIINSNRSYFKLPITTASNILSNAECVANVLGIALQADDRTKLNAQRHDRSELESTLGVARPAKFSLSNTGHFVTSSQHGISGHRVWRQCSEC